MKILIADDHAVLRKGLIQILTEEFPRRAIPRGRDHVGDTGLSGP